MTPAETMEILPPVQSEEERERIRQQALVDSARNLSIDERYVLRRLVNLVAQDPGTASRHIGKLVTLPVAEFAAHAGITFKVARRRLDMAAYALFERSVSIHFHDEGTIFRWAEKLAYTEDYYELRFSSTFIGYLAWIVGDIRAGASRSLLSFAEAINAPAFVARGAKVPGDLSIVHISRLKARTKRPKSLKWDQLSGRVRKRLKRHMSRDEVEDVAHAAYHKSPQAKLRGKYHDYSHREIAGLYDWIMMNKDKPGFMDF